MKTAERTLAEVLTLVGRCKFRGFTQSDWMGYAGCESENPLIGEVPYEGPKNAVTLMIIDGETIWLQDIPLDSGDCPDEGRSYRLTEV